MQPTLTPYTVLFPLTSPNLFDFWHMALLRGIEFYRVASFNDKLRATNR